jgi:hypothetical protein
MSSPSPPAAPDPKETAAAQTGTNVSTAIANAALQNVNQVTPYGNLTYSQSGSKSVYDPSTGTTYDVPQYTATQTLSPQQQSILDQTQGAQQNLANTANQQSAFLQNYLNTPADLNTINQSTADNIVNLQKQRLDPQVQQQNQQFQAQMANQGIAPGSQAYDNAYRDLTNSQNDAYNQLYLGAQNTAFNQALTARQEPINEITALMSGSQVSQPNYVNTNEPTIPTTDYAGIVNQNFNQQMAGYNAQATQSNQLMGGMFGLGSSLLMMSDERLKTDIEKVGKVEGHNIYKFRYKSGGPMQLGVIAQEVEKKDPSAVVTTESGYKAVDYGKALKLGAA